MVVINFKPSLRMKAGVAPIIAFSVLIVILLVFDASNLVFDAPYLQFVLQAVFVFGSSMVIAVISARAYLASGSINVLLLGSAVFISGLASIIGSWAVSLSANEAVTIGNCGILISSFIMLLSAVITLAGKSPGTNLNRSLILIIVFLVSLLAVATISLLAAFDFTPKFLTSTGPTATRLIVLAVSTILYFESSLIIGLRYWQIKSDILYWYSLALGLFSLALVAAFLTIHLGDLANWVSRLALYLSGVYFLFALLGKETQNESFSDLSANWAEAFRLDGKQSETLFANLLNGFMYCKIETDSAGKPVDWIYLAVNNAFENIIGLKKEAVLTKKATDISPQRPKDLEDSIKRYGQVALFGKPAKFEIYRESFGKWLNVSAYSPKKGYFVSIFEDITEQKKAEIALRENGERLKRSQEMAHLGSWELDLINDKLTWSDEVYRIFGLKPQEFGATYEAFLNAVHPEDRAAVDCAYSGSVMAGLDSYENEHRIIRKDNGEVRFVHEKCNHLHNEQGKIVRSLGMVHDITESKLLQQQLEDNTRNLEKIVDERTRQLKDSERLAAIGATAGMVGHDIRNPLQAITGDVYLVKSDLSALAESKEKENIMESLKEIEKNVDYINKIVEDLQDYARPIVPSIQKINFETLCQEVLLKKAIPENIETSCIVEKDEKTIFADPALLKRILSNLVNNAVQAMPNGGKISLSNHREAGNAVITIEDTGSGIPEEAKPKLFTPLFTTKSKGQGFGLSVVKRMTESLGGTVSFKSQMGKGTTFTISLPQEQTQ
jgi:PAS domain S-box-containing protein